MKLHLLKEIPTKVYVIVAIMIICLILTKVFWGDVLGLTNNILAESIGIFVTVIIVNIILAARWIPVRERIFIRIKHFLKQTVFRLKFGFDIFPAQESWTERTLKEEIGDIKNANLQDKLKKLSVGQLEHFRNLIDKIGRDLIKIQTKIGIKPIPKVWINLDEFEEILLNLELYFEQYLESKKNYPPEQKQTITDKVFAPLIIKEINKLIPNIEQLKEVVDSV